MRLQGYDYTQGGAYFVTICTHDRRCLFGHISDGNMALSAAGMIAEQCWQEIPAHFSHTALGAFVVMPNHIHGIIIISRGVAIPSVGTPPSVGTWHAVSVPGQSSSLEAFSKPVPGSLSTIIRSFKSAASRQLNVGMAHMAAPVWQPRFYEHIIRSDRAFGLITDYINSNPQKWEEDRENPNTCL